MLPSSIFLLPIPDIFWSEYLSGPFTECIDCSCSLDQVPAFIIQKKLVAGEAVFEMAMCGTCRQALASKYSEETKTNINRRMEDQFERNMKADASVDNDRQATTWSGSELLQSCLDHCLFCNASRKQTRRYSLAGLFIQSSIVVQRNRYGQSPVMVCDDCERELGTLISKQTRDNWDRFIGEHFDGPPGVENDSPADHPMYF